ncbi:MAG: hypothetical protein MK179_14030 [Pirellulaceae bacterium]|nr:hypothetical protein [Pirellulaceae bacterium]
MTNYRVTYWLLFCLIFTGCNSSPYPLAPVSGTVRVDGQTLSGGSVVFRRIADDKNKNVGKAGYGEIKSDGTFVLGTFANTDGGIVGDHHVMVNCQLEGQNPSLVKIGLERKFTVVAGEDNVFEIDLTSEDVARGAENERRFQESRGG